MLRFLLAGLMATALVAAAGLPTTADDKKVEKKDAPKKDAPKKKERIAVADPAKVKDDADFAVQGEYEGTLTTPRKPVKVGAQVVVKGDGEFMVKVFRGGLPGAGASGAATVATAKRGADGTVAITGKDLSGSVSAGKLTLAGGAAFDSTLTRVERKSPTLGAKPPSGAVVLFGAPGDESNWAGGKITELSDGKYLGVGSKTKQKFGAFKVHVEFRTPWMPNSSGQGRGNSGFYLQDRYELQVLDSFGLNGENNEAGGFYTLHKPSVNMCFPPLSWQTYDIDFTPAAFDADGKKTANARATVIHNGVKVQDNVELKKETGGGTAEKPEPGPFQIQNHGDPLVFNNIWVVEVK